MLTGLLLGSVAINLKQSQDVANLEARSSGRAGARRGERIDSETARADRAEAALDRVGSAVDLVASVLGLQDIDGLRERLFARRGRARPRSALPRGVARRSPLGKSPTRG